MVEKLVMPPMTQWGLWPARHAAQRSVAQSLARAWGPKKIHVSYLIIDGMIQREKMKAFMPGKPDDFFLDSDDIAETVWNVVNQKPSSWTFELNVRPFGDLIPLVIPIL
jgi:hypothetical protein